MVIYFLSLRRLCLFFPNRQPGDRVIHPKISGILRSSEWLAALALLPVSIDGRDHSAGVEAAPLSRARANASTPPGATSRAAGPDQSHTDRREQGGRGSAGGSGRRARQRFDSTVSANI